MANLPYQAPKECEDAQNFVQRQSLIGKEVPEVLNAEHQMEAEQVNAHRSESPVFQVCHKVWYRRPENRGRQSGVQSALGWFIE